MFMMERKKKKGKEGKGRFSFHDLKERNERNGNEMKGDYVGRFRELSKGGGGGTS